MRVKQHGKEKHEIYNDRRLAFAVLLFFLYSFPFVFIFFFNKLYIIFFFAVLYYNFFFFRNDTYTLRYA